MLISGTTHLIPVEVVQSPKEHVSVFYQNTDLQRTICSLHSKNFFLVYTLYNLADYVII